MLLPRSVYVLCFQNVSTNQVDSRGRVSTHVETARWDLAKGVKQLGTKAEQHHRVANSPKHSSTPGASTKILDTWLRNNVARNVSRTILEADRMVALRGPRIPLVDVCHRGREIAVAHRKFDFDRIVSADRALRKAQRCTLVGRGPDRLREKLVADTALALPP